MEIAWGKFWQVSRGRLRTGWLITAGLVAVYIGAIEPMNRYREIATQGETGIGAVAFDSNAMWHEMRPLHALLRKDTPEDGYIAGVAGARKSVVLEMAANDALPAPPPPPGASADRKMVRTAAMELTVKSPRETSEKVRQLAERLGGFLVTSETNGGQEASTASLQIRVPAAKFEEARGEIRKLGLRVESEKLNAEDVTKQYVDQSARLRNLRAQETQYLGIMKQAKTVKDTIEVSEKLDEVRGEIETQQAEFDALSKQVETVALMVTLRAEAEAQVFGLHWRPLYQLKLAARQGIESVGDYALAMTSLLFYLPSIVLWLGTILLGAAAGWRILKWVGRALFVPRAKPTMA